MIEDHDSGGGPPSGLRDALMRWLLHDAVDERFLDDVFAGFCDRLRRHGVAVAHATLHLRTNHPQWLGIEILWRTGCRAPRSRNLDYGLFGTEGFRGSPAARIMAGAAMVRQRRGETGDEAHPEVAGLMAVEGLTDFVAWPLRYTLGKRHMAASPATGRAGSSRPRSNSWPSCCRRSPSSPRCATRTA